MNTQEKPIVQGAKTWGKGEISPSSHTKKELLTNKFWKKNFYKEASIWGFFSSFLHPYFQVTDWPLKDQLQQEQDTQREKELVCIKIISEVLKIIYEYLGKKP